MYLTVSQNILNGLVAFLVPLVGVAMLIFCVIQGYKLLKGADGASAKKLIGGVVAFLFIVGLMYLTKSFPTLGKTFSSFTNKTITKTTKDGTGIIDGTIK